MKELVITLIMVILALIMVYFFSDHELSNDNNIVKDTIDYEKVYNYYRNNKTQGYQPCEVSNSYRMGPVFLKVNEDWVFEQNEKQFFRIGLKKESSYRSDDIEYEQITPKALASATNELSIAPDKSRSKDSRDIVSFDIEFNEEGLWIDLNIHAINIVQSDGKAIGILIMDAKEFYIYHPKLNKWFGAVDRSPFSFEMTMYSELFNENNTRQDIVKLLDKSLNDRINVLEDIINRRTIKIPSVKYYDEKLAEFSVATKERGRWEIYEWFVEK